MFPDDTVDSAAGSITGEIGGLAMPAVTVTGSGPTLNIADTMTGSNARNWLFWLVVAALAVAVFSRKR